MDYYRADDLVGFIKEWRRLNPGKHGAVYAWGQIYLASGDHDN